MLIRTLQTVSRLVSWIAWAGIAFMMISLTYDVVQRQTNIGLVAGLLEYNETLLVFVIFASLAYAQQVDAHVSTDVVYRLLPPRVGRLLQAAGLLMAAIAIAWAITVSWHVGLDAMARGEYRAGRARVPTWQARLFIPFALTLLLSEVLIRVVGLFRPDEDETSVAVAGGASPDRATGPPT
jgi:TRAP-type mannitol/chloroaromatic compound transport system permease small subunit